MKEEKVIRELECTLQEFIDIYKDDDSQRQYHLDRGDINIVFAPFVGTSSGVEARSIQFQAPINAPPSVTKIIGKDATTIVEKQSITITKSATTGKSNSGSNILSVKIDTSYKPDIMGDYFQVETEWLLIPAKSNPKSTQLTLSIRASFDMRFVGHIFEMFISKAAAASATQYVDIVEQRLEKTKESRLLQLRQQLEQQLLLEKQQQEKEKEQEREKEREREREKEKELHIQQQQQKIISTSKFELNDTQIEKYNQSDKHDSNSNSKNQQNKKKKRTNKFKNWTVDCKKQVVEDYLKSDLDELKEYTRDTSQSLLKIEISLSEMKSGNNSVNSSMNNNNSFDNINNSYESNNSITSSPSTSQSSFTYLNGANHHSHQHYPSNQVIHHQQQQQQNSDTLDQLNSVISLLRQIELNNRVLREKRRMAEESIDQELSAMLSYLSNQHQSDENNNSSNNNNSSSILGSANLSNWLVGFESTPLVTKLIIIVTTIFSIFAVSKSIYSAATNKPSNNNNIGSTLSSIVATTLPSSMSITPSLVTTTNNISSTTSGAATATSTLFGNKVLNLFNKFSQ